MKLIIRIISKVYKLIEYCNRVVEEEKYICEIKDIGKNCRIVYPSRILNGQRIAIGNDFYCGFQSRIEAICDYQPTNQKFQPIIKIGDDVRIQGNCHIGAINSIVIGNHVLMGNGVFITDHEHGKTDEISVSPNNRNLFSKGKVKIGDNVWICDQVTILPGVTIGSGVTIATKSVVTKDIPSNSVAAGIPAKVIKTIKDN